MKVIVMFLVLMLPPFLARADVGVVSPEPDHTDEAITIMVGTIATVGNVMTLAAKSPNYWLGALGAASGVTALVMRGQPDAEHESGLLAVGLLGVTTGAVALRYRYVLDHKKEQARIEPTWTGGSPGIALVVDF